MCYGYPSEWGANYNNNTKKEEKTNKNGEEDVTPINLKEYNHHKGYTSKKTWANFLKIREDLLKLNPEIVFGSNKYFVSLYYMKQNFAVIRFRKNSINVFKNITYLCT